MHISLLSRESGARRARRARFVQGRIAPRRISSRMPWVWAESFPILFRNYTIINIGIKENRPHGRKKKSARSLKGNGGTLLSPLVCPLEVLEFFWPVRPSHWACNPRQLLPDFRPGLTQTVQRVRQQCSDEKASLKTRCGLKREMCVRVE